jgi:hypothetical protein
MLAVESKCSVTSTSVLGKGKPCNSGGHALSKQSLKGQVSVKLTPEICINNASSNSRLTAAGRWATASDSHSQTCLQAIFFFFFLSLPLMRQQLNYTCMLKNLLKLHCIWTWDTLWCFGFFCFLFLFPLRWDNDRTTSETPSPGLEAEGLTPKLLRLKLYCIWTWRFILFILFYFSILSVSL